MLANGAYKDSHLAPEDNVVVREAHTENDSSPGLKYIATQLSWNYARAH